MKIAVACQNRRTVTAHPGKTLFFRLFQSLPTGDLVALPPLELAKDMMLHGYHPEAPHPLLEVDVILAKTAGQGFLARVACHGVRLAVTDIEDPEEAARAYVAGLIPDITAFDSAGASLRMDHLGLHHGLGHGHGHGKGHGHGHGHGCQGHPV